MGSVVVIAVVSVVPSPLVTGTVVVMVSVAGAKVAAGTAVGAVAGVAGIAHAAISIAARLDPAMPRISFCIAFSKDIYILLRANLHTLRKVYYWLV